MPARIRRGGQLIKRRSLPIALAGLVLPAPVFAQRRARLPVIGVLWGGRSADDESGFREPLLEGLTQHGHVPGRTVTLDERFADGDPDRFVQEAQGLVRDRVDLIVAVSIQSALAAQQATRTIPVVFLPPSDPVGLGLVHSLSHPGGNLTGLSSITYDLESKRLQLIRECLPDLSRLALLTDGLAPPTVMTATANAAREAGLEATLFYARSREDVEPMLRRIAEARMQAVLMPAARRILYNAKVELARAALAQRLPLVAPAEMFVQDGAFMSYGANLTLLFRRVGWYVDRILKGTPPADLPVEQASRVDLWLNLRTAAALGIEIPPSVMARAERMIE